MKQELKGIYLVIDPQLDQDELISKLKSILKAGVGAIQIWDHWAEDQNREAFVNQIKALADGVPVLINNDFELASATGVDGVHLDDTSRIETIPLAWRKEWIIGVTLTLATDWQELKEQEVDYISFCSMFPSSSTDACELVDFQTVREACNYFPGSVFASGGIDLENANEIIKLGVSGIALISALLQSRDPFEVTKKFNEKLKIR